MIRIAEEKLGFPKEAVDFLEDEYKKILTFDGASDLIFQAQRHCFNGEKEECERLLSTVSTVCDFSGVRRYALDMIFLLLSLEPLKARFIEYGYGEELF